MQKLEWEIHNLVRYLRSHKWNIVPQKKKKQTTPDDEA